MRYFITSILAASVLVACGASESASQDKQTTISAKSSSKTLTPIQRGSKVFRKCRTCHTLEEGGRNKVGPNLWGVYGATTASKDGYAYSKAMKAANIVWDEDSLDSYLRKPAEFMPGTKMTFIGIKKQEDRDALQIFLKEKTSSAEILDTETTDVETRQP